MTDLVAVARETLAAVERGSYTAPSGAVRALEADARAAREGTRTFAPDEVEALARELAPGERATRIEVTDESTLAAARRLATDGARSVALLNFASAHNAGGGFLEGSVAQEEDLCRCSALYHAIEPARAYYEANRAHTGGLYTDHLIHSPRVPFFRDDANAYAFLEQPLLAGVLTSPAPNTAFVVRRAPFQLGGLVPTFRRRALQVVAAAAERGHDALVLGAWGCGAFGGDPAVSADAFARALEDPAAGRFERVVFAVLARGEAGARNLAAFRERFAGA